MIDWRRLSRRLGVALNLRDPPNVPPYGWSYFDHLVAVYVTLNTADARADVLIKKSRERADDLTWGDIFLMENIIFSLQPPEVVDRNAWILRERFREIASPTVYEKYLNSHVPIDTDTPSKLTFLKADLTRILDVLHWYYSLIPIRERIRKTLTINCISMVVLYTGALGVVLAWCYWHHQEFAAMISCVIYWGIIGGFVSSQRRMQSIPTDGDPLISVFGLDNAGYYLWLSPMLGAIFALILTWMFIGGVLSGVAFPDFHKVAGDHGAAAAQAFATVNGVAADRVGLGFFKFAWETLPRTSEDYGKLFVWAFLAGFAERLVPDSLDRLSAKLSPSGQPAFVKSVTNDSSETTVVAQPKPEEEADEKSKITTETLQDVMHTGEIKPEPHLGEEKKAPEDL
jgi:hypothetical protein